VVDADVDGDKSVRAEKRTRKPASAATRMRRRPTKLCSLLAFMETRWRALRTCTELDMQRDQESCSISPVLLGAMVERFIGGRRCMYDA
jgi:hypothetical protein